MVKGRGLPLFRSVPGELHRNGFRFLCLHTAELLRHTVHFLRPVHLVHQGLVASGILFYSFSDRPDFGERGAGKADGRCYPVGSFSLDRSGKFFRTYCRFSPAVDFAGFFLPLLRSLSSKRFQSMGKFKGFGWNKCLTLRVLIADPAVPVGPLENPAQSARILYHLYILPVHARIMSCHQALCPARHIRRSALLNLRALREGRFV